MKLYVNGDILPITHMGPDYLIVKNPLAHPPMQAEIEMWVDDDQRRWPVYLINGISATNGRTRIAKVS